MLDIGYKLRSGGSWPHQLKVNSGLCEVGRWAALGCTSIVGEEWHEEGGVTDVCRRGEPG